MDLWLQLRRLRRRVRRLERRELSAARRWLEDTENLLHLSVLLVVPALLAVVTATATAVPSLSFLLFPPLASAAYTLFAQPEGRYADSTRLVVGLTIGAFCGWIALATVGEPGAGVSAWAAGLSVLLTGGLTWALDVEEPAAYAVALLLLVQEAPPGVYVASVAVASGIVAVAYEVWHDALYERRAELLYASTGTDDDILVPMVEGADPVALLAARLASGYDRGRVVLLGMQERSEREPAADDSGVADGGTPESESGEAASGGSESGDVEPPEAASGDAEPLGAEPGDAGSLDAEAPESEPLEPAPAGVDTPGLETSDRDALVADLEARADDLTAETGATVEVVVAAGSDPTAIATEAARETGCDLVIAPFDGDGATSFVTSLFGTDLDVAAARASRQRWNQILVPIRSAGDLAHLKVDVARRLTGPDGRVTVAHCIDAESDRRHAEAMCANVVDPYEARFETLVASAGIEQFLADHARANDLILLGASTDRSRVSRLFSRPTYERVADLPTDLLVVHSGRH